MYRMSLPARTRFPGCSQRNQSKRRKRRPNRNHRGSTASMVVRGIPFLARESIPRPAACLTILYNLHCAKSARSPLLWIDQPLSVPHPNFGIKKLRYPAPSAFMQGDNAMPLLSLNSAARMLFAFMLAAALSAGVQAQDAALPQAPQPVPNRTSQQQFNLKDYSKPQSAF